MVNEDVQNAFFTHEYDVQSVADGVSWRVRQRQFDIHVHLQSALMQPINMTCFCHNSCCLQYICQVSGEFSHPSATYCLCCLNAQDRAHYASNLGFLDVILCIHFARLVATKCPYPNLSPADYKIWSIIQKPVYGVKIGRAFYPLIARLKRQSNGPSYSNTVITTPTTPGGSHMTASLGGRYDPWPVKRSTDWLTDWYTGRWWVGRYIWYSEEGTGRGPSPLRPLLAVQNVTAHPSTASVPTSYFSMWHYNCLWSLKS